MERLKGVSLKEDIREEEFEEEYSIPFHQEEKSQNYIEEPSNISQSIKNREIADCEDLFVRSSKEGKPIGFKCIFYLIVSSKIRQLITSGDCFLILERKQALIIIDDVFNKANFMILVGIANNRKWYFFDLVLPLLIVVVGVGEGSLHQDTSKSSGS